MRLKFLVEQQVDEPEEGQAREYEKKKYGEERALQTGFNLLFPEFEALSAETFQLVFHL